MIRRQDYSVLLLHYLGYAGVRNLVFRLRNRALARIIAFHDIQPEDVGTFTANLTFLRDRTNVVSLDDVFAGRLSRKAVNIVITFDDGYRSWTDYAVPALKGLGLPAIFFVSSGFVGLDREREDEFARSNLFKRWGSRKISGGLSVEELREIARQGFDIGGHTLNHGDLARLEDPGELTREISEDKRNLEGLTGREVRYFAYPFGGCAAPRLDLAEALARAGYRGAVTTVPGYIEHPAKDPYRLPRETTSARMPGRVFRARVLGNYDGVVSIRKALRTLSRRSAAGRSREGQGGSMS